MERLRGVNLGGWLILERWMTPSLFEGTAARDEYEWMQQHGTDAASLIDKHRSGYITVTDLEWLSQHGVNAVRLPVPHWIFGGFQPYIECQKYVDWLLEQAGKYGLKVVLDLHAAPGSQNGNDHSGRAGAVHWTEQNNVQATLNTLSNIADEYAHHPQVAAIQLLNEPSSAIPHQQLLDYYEAGIKIVQDANPNLPVIVSDAYRPYDWRGSQLGRHKNVYLDVHMYQCFSVADKKLDIHKHLKKAQQEWADMIHELQHTMPVVIGEWSLGLDNQTFRGMGDFERDKALQAYANAQLDTFAQSAGWFFWNYKTESPGGWNFRDCISRGWLQL